MDDTKQTFDINAEAKLPVSPAAPETPVIPTELVVEKGTRKKMKEMDVHPVEMMQPQQPKKQFAVLDKKDMRKLTANGYDKAKERFKNVYLIRNDKTGKIAEIHAASSVHAATLLGWNPKRVTLLMSREVPAEPKAKKPLCGCHEVGCPNEVQSFTMTEASVNQHPKT